MFTKKGLLFTIFLPPRNGESHCNVTSKRRENRIMTQKNERAFLLYTLAHINTHSDIWTENCLPFLLLTQTFGVPKRQKRKTNYQWLELKWVKVRHICLWFTWANPASKSPARSPWLQGLIFQLPPQRPAAPPRGCSHDLVLLVPDPVRSIAHHATTVCYIGFNHWAGLSVFKRFLNKQIWKSPQHLVKWRSTL